MPPNGRLTAQMFGRICTFDGAVWDTPDAVITRMLNQATASAPKCHFTILELAEHVITKLGWAGHARVTSWTPGPQPAPLPPGAVD